MAARVRIGALVPPGNPTVEPEFYRMAPPGVSVHFARLGSGEAAGAAGAAEGMEARARAYVESLPASARTLAEVTPAVVVLAHTAASYVTGFAREGTLAARLDALAGAPAVTAPGAVLAALRRFGVKRLALATPYPESISALARAYWEAAGFEITAYRRLEGMTNIYEETEERAAQPARAEGRRRDARASAGCCASRREGRLSRGRRPSAASAGHRRSRSSCR
jgi:maleate cis-trans isomerase